MKVSVSDAKGLLTDLVKRAEAGEEVVLTRYGQPVARIVRVVSRPHEAERRAIIRSVQAAARAKATSGPSAARSQDYLYDKDGLPV